MIQLLVLIVIIVIVYVSLKMHLENISSEVDYVISGYDQHSYLVRNLPDKNKAADLLSLIRQRLITLTEYLRRVYPNDPRTQRLLEKFNPDKLSEGGPNGLYTSYSVNKGEKIVFCIRQRDQQEKLLDINTMIFVAIHELAHIMTQSVGHTPEFWNNMKFLLQVATTDLKIYAYQPYHQKPQPYCGIVITDTPLKQ